VLVQGIGVSGTLTDWWFEDDTMHRVFVRDHTNPLAYFGPELVSKLSYGSSVTPWFTFTFWIDHVLSPSESGVAYAHSLASVYLTACLLYAVLAHWIDHRYALFAALFWPFLPTTVVTMEFLSTRHYLEGLLFSLIAVRLAQKAVEPDGNKNLIYGAAALYLLACCAKEVYVTGTWLMLTAIYLKTRHYRAVAGMFGCGLLYVVYRFWCLGIGGGKEMDVSFLAGYGDYLIAAPWMWTGNGGGYILIALALALWLFAWRKLHWTTQLFFPAMVVVLLVTVLPVTLHVYASRDALGPWYRVLFLFHSFLWAATVALAAKTLSARIAWLPALFAAFVLVWGGRRTADSWDSLKAGYLADGRFYLEHPDRLLYSAEPAPWFLFGLHRLYKPDEEPHYLTWRADNGTPEAYIREALEEHGVVWRRGEDGIYRRDPALRERIEVNLENGVTPLHRGR